MMLRLLRRTNLKENQVPHCRSPRVPLHRLRPVQPVSRFRVPWVPLPPRTFVPVHDGTGCHSGRAPVGR